MNASECDSLIASVEWTEPRKILLLAILIFIDILVIVGNTLVVAAVTSSHKLRSVTNFFIVSLAVADLLVGLAVLPFSATWEVFKVWIFGDVWCRVWLAVDVWMCTASILNLCAISLDRYVAVTRPVTYPSIMSTRRAKSLIAGLWVLSFVICFPPLVGWKEQKVKENLLYQYGNHTPVSSTPVPSSFPYSSSSSSSPFLLFSPSSSSPFLSLSPVTSTVAVLPSSPSSPSSFPGFNDEGGGGGTVPNPPCPWTCELTNDAGYVVYSALGSFYIPMFVMLFFYWRIYRAAERTTRAINQGFRTTKGMGTRFDDNRLTLRIHRGRGSTASAHGPNPVPASVTAAAAAASTGASHLHESPHSNGSTHSTTTSLGSASPERLSRYSTRCKNHEKIKISVSYPSTENLAASGGGEGSKLLYAVHYSSNGGKEHTASQIFRRPSKDKRGKGQRGDNGQGQQKEYLTVDGRERGLLSPRSSKRMGKRNIKAQVKRFRMETKAAKTLAIIVGLFILCWLPFFTMYLVRPFCEDCINETLFSILFWLGYCNSAINPMIYALFSKDFRFAFKRLICRFFCSAEAIPRPASRRGSDMSQIRGHHGSRAPSISPSAAAQSLGEDSDPMLTLAGDLSDSR